MISRLRCMLFTCLPALPLLAQSPQPVAQPTPRPAAQAQVSEHEQKAHAYLAAHQPLLAIPEFQAVVAADPTNLDAQANLGVLLYFANQPAQAEPHLAAALQASPGLTRIEALLGMCQHALGQNRDALTHLQAAFPALDGDPKIKTQVGLEILEIDTATGDLESAAALLPALRAASPENPEVLYAAYRVYTDLAGERLLDLSLVAPHSALMYQAIAHEQIRAGDLNDAIANLRKAVALNPKLPGIHYELGEALRSSPDLATRANAPAEYRQALALDPRDATSMVRLGDIAADAGNQDQAAAEYSKALAIAPQDEDASIGLARTYIEGDKPADALPLLEGVLAADPTSLDALFRLSTAYRKLHRPADAERTLAQYQKLKAVKDQLSSLYQQLRMDHAGPGGMAGGSSAPR